MHGVSLASAVLFVLLGTVSLRTLADASAPSSRRMLDGREWTTANSSVDRPSSYCYDGLGLNCRRYGRLYSWQAARRVCQSLGEVWRLPTESEWRQLAKQYGGVREDSESAGTAAYSALLIGGTSGFNAMLGGNRSERGEYERVQAHGFYWTASETGAGTAWFYNFGEGGQSLNRQREGDKRMAMSVRCIRA